MITRAIEEHIKTFIGKMPVLAILGPRQSGKTTVVRKLFSQFVYVSLEDLDTRKRAKEDPRTFLHQGDVRGGLIIDEVQYVPELLSYMQTIVDAPECKALYVLTGSQNILVHEALNQSLAGRVRIFTLLPLSMYELEKIPDLLPKTIDEALFTGGYPRIYDQSLAPNFWYADYISTYLERDVRLLQHIIHLDKFQHFIMLCAGRVGQVLNLTSLANDCGVSVPTIDSWLSLLQASYMIFLLQPYYNNFSKRLIKSPKLYFYDVGIVCSLLNIQSVEQVYTYHSRGNLFENLIVSEFLKSYFNRGLKPRLYFWRDTVGHEVDLIFERGTEICAVEIKSTTLAASDAFTGLTKMVKYSDSKITSSYVVYGGLIDEVWNQGNFISWRSIDGLITL